MKKHIKTLNMMIILAFVFTMIMPVSSVLAAETESETVTGHGSDLVLSTDKASGDTIYPADWGKKLECIELEVPGEFGLGNEIKLTLSEGILWYMDESRFNRLDIEEMEWQGISDDNKTISLKVDKRDLDEIELEGLEVAVLPDAPQGDITVTVSGDYQGAVVAGEVVPGIEISAEVVPVKADAAPHVVGSIILKESETDGLSVRTGSERMAAGQYYIGIILPAGVTFADKPAVKVNNREVDAVLYGECDWDNPGGVFDGAKHFKAGDNECYIKFKEENRFDSKSKETIEIGNLVYEVKKDFGIGEIEVEICGDMLNKLIGAGDTVVKDLQDKYLIEPVHTVINASTRTPVPDQGKLTIGSKTMYIDGEAIEMDVYPLLRKGRTYLPVRYAAYAMGMDDKDIVWNESDQTVTLTRDEKVVRLQIGSTIMMDGDEAVTMDAIPEIVWNRTMLPVRFVAEAFGASIEWKELTRTIIISNPQE